MHETKIVKIEKIENRYSKYDVEVEDNNNLFANGILVHNCRCFAYIKDGGAVLMSRKGKFFPNKIDIKNALTKLPPNLILDGELFSDEISFERITGAVRRITIETKQERADDALLQLRVYDVYDTSNPEMTFKNRNTLYHKTVEDLNCPGIISVETHECANEKQMKTQHDEFVQQGHEGIILRNKEGVYKLNARSQDLQKYKHFFDAEYKIVSFTDGKGKDEGTVIWVCETEDGTRFAVRPKGTYAQRSEWFKNGKSFINKQLTVRYQELTAKELIPRFGVGISIRDYE